jgi:hypothetical protein
MVNRLLFLEPGQLRRAWPFLALYLVLFAALTLADGLSLTLFVSRVGAEQLPRYQALAAVFVMLSVVGYLQGGATFRLAKSQPQPAAPQTADRVFVYILAGPMLLFALIGAGLCWGVTSELCLGLLFLGREVMFALVLLHFGAYLQDYFSRAELNRVMPVIYAGGRVGGILGGAVLQHTSASVGPARLLLLLAALLAVCMIGVKIISRRATLVDEPLDPAAPESAEAGGAAAADSPGMLSLVWRSPLLFWITISTATLFFCRFGLALQCGLCFERELPDDVALAQFLGRYAQIALAASLVLQLFVVGRLVNWLGLRGAQLIYAVLVAAAALSGWGGMTLAAAVAARFVEGELRYGLRNPLAQMTLNLLPRRIRTQARAWSLGLVIPAATLVAALALEFLMRQGALHAVATVTLAAGCAYLAATVGLAKSISEPLPATETLAATRGQGELPAAGVQPPVRSAGLPAGSKRPEFYGVTGNSASSDSATVAPAFFSSATFASAGSLGPNTFFICRSCVIAHERCCSRTSAASVICPGVYAATRHALLPSSRSHRSSWPNLASMSILWACSASNTTAFVFSSPRSM